MDRGKEVDLIAFGCLVRERRKAMGLSQHELGARIDWAQERVSALERGRYGLPSVPSLIRLARSLDISLGVIIGALGFTDVRLDDAAPAALDLVESGDEPVLSLAAGAASERSPYAPVYAIGFVVKRLASLNEVTLISQECLSRSHRQIESVKEMYARKPDWLQALTGDRCDGTRQTALSGDSTS
jgi:transcriptional regulator with XRE-family HTH domain